MQPDAHAGSLALRVLRSRVFSEASAAALESAINTWLEDRDEEQLVAVEYAVDGGAYSAIILFTE